MSWLRRALLVLCALAILWSVLITLTSGIVVHLGVIRLSSRSAVRPLVAAVILATGAGAWRRASDFPLVVAVVGSGVAIAQWMHAAPLWLDEEMIALNVRDRSLARLAGALWLGQSAPFGWLALQRLMVVGAGTGERALRFVPLAFGVATILAAMWIGRRWMGGVAAAVFVLLCASGEWIAASFDELKHYSADAFWALWLPGLAAWAIEADGSAAAGHRLLIWWLAAAAGQWFGNGALLVTPACALIIVAAAWRRGRWRAALTFAAYGAVWAVAFATHYLIAMRYTVGSEYLRSYWSLAFPPASGGVVATLVWLKAQLPPLALKPGGTGLWLLFWGSAVCGLASSRSRTLGVLHASVPVSACVLAALRIIPLYERLSLWTVPALYLGIALLTDTGVRLFREARTRRDAARAAIALVTATAVLALCSDIVVRGYRSVGVRLSTTSNHRLDDRSAVRWLMDQRQPGDALLTTALALPALWWYGGIPVSDEELPGSRQPDGSPIFEAGYRRSGPGCGPDARPNWEGVARSPRVLVYFGFRFDDVPQEYDALLLEDLAAIGEVKAFHYFAASGRGAVVEIRSARQDPAGATHGRRLDGCVTVRVARRW